MNDTLPRLRQRLKINTMEIEQLVAKEHNMGELNELSPDDYVRLKNISEKLLLQWAEAQHERLERGDDSPFNRLAAEHFELQQKLRAIQELD